MHGEEERAVMMPGAVVCFLILSVNKPITTAREHRNMFELAKQFDSSIQV